MHSTKSIIKVFLGCCLSAFLMEILMAYTPESANFVTFSQFLFITLQGFAVTTKFGTWYYVAITMTCWYRYCHNLIFAFLRETPKIPLKQYTILVTLFFLTSVANNYVYALHVPSTLHMIIRSASSPASMLVYCYKKKQIPKLNNAVGSVLISVGVALAMYGGAPLTEQKGIFLYWCIGVTILLITLITGAFTGLQQEMLYAKYGKHPNEMLFYTHAIPMPLFMGIYPELVHISQKLTWGLWICVVLNIISQYYCTHSVHSLATKETTVTVTFILTLRKFLSLLISSIIFKNNLTIFHLVGTIFVAVGTYVYFDYFTGTKQRPVSIKDK